MSRLFEPISVRGLTVPNRVWVSPMCQYSSVDGLPDDWHLMHLGQFAAGGAGLVCTEASAIVAEGRISPQDAGIWNDDQVTAWRRVTGFLHAQGSAAAMQLAHAGRKASTHRPWEAGGTVPASEGGWRSVGPSPLAFGKYATPRELTEAEVAAVPGQFAAAARRAVGAGFDAVELHFAHGYLVHEFYSPLSNQRTDRYGGDFTGRTRLALEVAEAVRAEVGENLPVFARLSASDWTSGGWDIEDSVRLAKLLDERGIDLIDTSSGGNTANPDIPVGPGYQVPFAERIRAEAGIATGAVGMITDPEQAEGIIANGQADVVFLARAMLRDPHWALRAADVLGAEVSWVNQYARARNRR
ncbi:oxidoreductase [Amycolatopsis antarctica]|uniref:Oxidoreductase n=1 Tax=Amycolatopsis antarctica TaxID=1854586 RepID=A0A263D4E6_9PSEU|nr:NADH:flavin oxidoreductase/NADH oxidase [Amycolatopsis antarctica]OZM73364.1 oxidoreductase [Amycolatopsis antarctica]